MYTIFLNLVVWVPSFGLFLVGHLTGNYDITVGGWVLFGFGCAILFGTTVAQFVQTGVVKQNIAEVKTRQKKIVFAEEKHTQLNEFYERQVLEVYPEFERKLLEALGPGKNTDLIALFQQYPELQSSKLLRQMVGNISNLVDNIYNRKENLEYTLEQIRVYQSNSWVLFKYTIPTEILEQL
jgi:hypothetical protein